MELIVGNTDREKEIIEHYIILVQSKDDDIFKLQREFDDFSQSSKELESELESALDAVIFLS